MTERSHPPGTSARGSEPPEIEPTIDDRGPPLEAPKRAETAKEHGQGDRIGRYTVLRTLGRGGMGVVYAAHDPELERPVALKLLIDGTGTSSARDRLLREAKAMAKLQHPNVVRIYDVGTHGGQVFVAMEYVDGTSLREWARKEKRPWREVLEIFVAAGRGLAAAHRTGIVHRDFKPDNVMLTREGVPKVMDFGLARAESGSVLDSSPAMTPREREPSSAAPPAKIDEAGKQGAMQTLPMNEGSSGSSAGGWERMTVTGTIMGTPAYMSPEQHLGKTAGAASDQFSFGASMWEALYGEVPFAGENAAAVGVSVVTGSFKAVPQERRVPSWLHDTILRAMATDPSERWPSMDTLLAELQRENTQRRRARWVIGAALGAAAAGAFAVVVSNLDPPPLAQSCGRIDMELERVWNDEQEERLRLAFDRTNLAFASSTADIVVGQLTAQALDLKEAAREACVATNVRKTQSQELFDLRMACLSERRRELATLVDLLTAAEPEIVEVAVDAARGLEPAETCADVRALRQSASTHARGPDAAALQRELIDLRALRLLERVEEGTPRAQRALLQAEALGDPSLIAQAAATLGDFQYTVDEFGAGRENAERAVWSAVEAGDDRVALFEALRLVGRMSDMAQTDEARIYLELAEALSARVDADYAIQANLHKARGSVALAEGKYDEARAEFELGLAAATSINEHDPAAADFHANLARALRRLGKTDAAIAHFEAAANMRARLVGQSHPSVATLWSDIGNVNIAAGRAEAANRNYERALRVIEDAFGPDHPRVARVLGNHANTHAALGDLERSIELVDRALEILGRQATTHPHLSIFKLNKGVSLWLLGRYEEAEVINREVLAYYEANRPAKHPDVATALDNLAASLASQGKYAEALPLFERALPMWEAAIGPESGPVAVSLTDRSRALIDRGTPEEAVPFLERALRFVDRIDYADYDRAEVRYLMATALRELKQDPERVTRLLRAADAQYENSGKRGEARRAEIAAWLED